MLTSLGAGLRLQHRLDPNAMYHFTTTMLTGDTITWQDMVEAFSGALPSYIALVLLDDSSTSRVLRQLISDHYLELDRITGDALLVLSTVPPPRDWFRHKISVIMKLPAWAQTFHNKEIYLLGTEMGRSTALINTASLLSEYFEDSISLPVLVFFQLTPSAEDPVKQEVRALSFDCSGLTSADRLLGAFVELAAVAKDGRRVDASSFKVARQAFSLANPTSLRWRNAAGRVMDSAKSLLEWLKSAKDLAQ